MLIKLLTEARKGRENSSAKRDSLFRPEDGYLQLVCNKGKLVPAYSRNVPKIPWMNHGFEYGSAMVNYGKTVWSTVVNHG